MSEISETKLERDRDRERSKSDGEEKVAVDCFDLENVKKLFL